MQYRIDLEGMEFRAYHGCYDLERKVGNRFVVDLELTTELGRVAKMAPPLGGKVRSVSVTLER